VSADTFAPTGPRRHQATIRSDKLVVALHDGLDGAIAAIADPARHAERLRDLVIA
jgi:hypothetical protein